MIKKFFLNGYTIGIASAIIAILATSTTDVLSHVPLFTTLKSLFGFLIAILLFKVSIWLFLIFIIAFVGILILISNINSKKIDKPVKIIPPDFLNYKEDTFKEWKWSWNYKLDNYQKKYIIEGLMPVCLKCNIKTIKDSFGDIYYCPNCTNSYGIYNNNQEHPAKIEALIIHNIENESY